MNHFKNLVILGYFRLSHCRSRHIFSSSPSSAERHRRTHLCWWFWRPTTGMSWRCPGAVWDQPASTLLSTREKIRIGNIWWIGSCQIVWMPLTPVKVLCWGRRCGLGHCPITETQPGMTIRTFSVWKLVGCSQTLQVALVVFFPDLLNSGCDSNHAVSAPFHHFG